MSRPNANGSSGSGGSGGSNQDRIDELLALAALGELTSADEAELDAALAADVELAAELDADLRTAAMLQSTLAEPPPSALKADVMAAIDALDDTAGDAVVDTAVDGPQERTADAVVDFSAAHRARSARRRGWQPLAAAAAVVTLLVGGVLVASRGGDEPNTFDAIAQADDGQERTLAGELGGTLEVVYSPSQDAFVLIGSGIPELVDAETYQLWFVDDDGARPIGLFRPDSDGRVAELYEGLDPTAFIVGVTVEPAAGSDTPTFPIVASA